MKLQKTDGSNEREILTGMIVDTIVCGRIAERWEKRLFRSKWANIVGLWCVTYHAKYGKAPRKQIEGLYKTWERKSHDKETVKIVNTFLSGLSDEYAELKREINPEYVLDKAGEYFSEVKLERLKEDLESDLVSNEIQKGVTRVKEFNPMRIGRGEIIEIGKDKEAWKQCFKEESQGIVKYPGVLGRFLGNQLARDSFVAFMGPEGRGKSFCLMDVAYRAWLQRCKVAFFEAGDMSQDQLMRRLATRITKRPLYPCTIKYPYKIRKNKKEYVAETNEKLFKKALDWRNTIKAASKIQRSLIRSKDSYLHIQCYQNSTLHVDMIESRLRELSREGWIADVVVIDYADILDMSYGRLDGRDRIDKMWRELRKISQMFHCLVVTATQTNRLSYDAKTITRKHSSEDKRKLAHVTGMLGINQTEEEKKQEIMRFNWIKVRDAKYLESKCVAVAGCLAIGNIAIRSTM